MISTNTYGGTTYRASVKKYVGLDYKGCQLRLRLEWVVGAPAQTNS